MLNQIRETTDLYATYEQILFLEHSKKASESFIYYLPDIVLILDSDGRILKANLAAEKVVNAKAGELIHTPVDRFFSKKNSVVFFDGIKNLKSQSTEEARVEFDLATDGLDLRCKDYHWKLSFIQGMQRKPGSLITAIGHDVTTIRKMFLKVQDSHIKLNNYSQELKKLVGVIEEQKNQMLEGSKLAQLGEMAGGIAQEIDLPIEKMTDDIKLLHKIALSENVSGFQKDLKELSGSIISTVDHVAKIIKTMRILARSGEGDSSEYCNVYEILNNILIYFREKFKNHGIFFALNCTETDIYVYAKSTKLSHIFINLLNNAFDAVENSSKGWIRVDVKVSGDAGKEVLEIYFFDSGDGVQKEHHNLIFQPFFTTKKSFQSIGTGLSSCRSLIKEFDGTVDYLDEEENTCFKICLPCKRDDEES